MFYGAFLSGSCKLIFLGRFSPPVFARATCVWRVRLPGFEYSSLVSSERVAYVGWKTLHVERRSAYCCADPARAGALCSGSRGAGVWSQQSHDAAGRTIGCQRLAERGRATARRVVRGVRPHVSHPAREQRQHAGGGQRHGQPIARSAASPERLGLFSRYRNRRYQFQWEPHPVGLVQRGIRHLQRAALAGQLDHDDPGYSSRNV